MIAEAIPRKCIISGEFLLDKQAFLQYFNGSVIKLLLPERKMFPQLAKSAVLSAAILFAADIYAGCAPKVIRRTNVRGSTKTTANFRLSASGTRRIDNNDISGQMKRLADDLEDIDRKLSRINSESRTALNHRQERERVSLKLIHMIQNELMDYKHNDGKRRKMALLLFNESKMLAQTAKNIKGFPMLDRMTDFQKFLDDIRSGKEKFRGKIPRSDSVLLKEIQKEQRRLLEEYHKQEQKNFRKK